MPAHRRDHPMLGAASPILGRAARAAWPPRRPRRGCGRRACAGSPRRGGRPSWLGDDEPLGDLRVAQAVGQQRQHLELARGQPGRVLARARSRPARESAHAALAQPARDDRRGGSGAQRLQLGERAPERLLLVGIGQRERRLVGAAELAATARPPRRIAGELQRDTAPPPPPRSPRRGRRAAATRRARRRAKGPAARRRAEAAPSVASCTAIAVALEPGDLGSSRPPPARAAAARRSARPAPTPRRAAATPPGRRAGRARAPRTTSALDARRGRRARNAQDGRGGVGRFRPAPLVELETCAKGEQVEPEQLKPSIAAVRDPRLQVPARFGVAALLDRDGGEHDEASAGLIAEPRTRARSSACSSLAVIGRTRRSSRARGTSISGASRRSRKLERALAPGDRLLPAAPRSDSSIARLA